MNKSKAIENIKSRLSASRIANAEENAKSMILNIRLAELRENMGIKQVDIGKFAQSSISKIENRKDIKLSTLRDYLHSIGMEVEIKARPMGSKSKKEEVLLLKD
ncbi:MAG: XRE family transcriptional regulator [Leptospirales bacterium]